MKVRVNPYGIVGLGVASSFALPQEWSLTEFCWSTWLAGLVYAWACVAAATVQILLTTGSYRPAFEARLPFLSRLSPALFMLGVAAVGLGAGLLAFRLYLFVFGFYGIFLSVFAEMEPHTLFGRNGFINSDFFTPLRYLVEQFWPMVAGVLISNWQDFFREDPWRRIVLPMQEEIVRVHVMVVALPFLSMAAWALVGGAYQSVTVLLLMGVFYLLPKKRPGG